MAGDRRWSRSQRGATVPTLALELPKRRRYLCCTLCPGSACDPGHSPGHGATSGRVAERLPTVVATCRQQGRPLLHFFVAASEAVLQSTAAPSLLSAPQGG